jgi:hypothetical protein
MRETLTAHACSASVVPQSDKILEPHLHRNGRHPEHNGRHPERSEGSLS